MHVEVLIPLFVVGALVLVGVGFLFARRDAGRGPHPDNPSGGTR